MRGFTLIETIIYLALLSFILTGTMLAVYGMLESGSSLLEKTATEDEGFFIMHKLDWMLSDLKSIDSPASGSDDSLTITQNDNTKFTVWLEDGVVIMCEGASCANRDDLTTENVEVSALTFARVSGTPAGIKATATIDGIDFSTTHYLHD